MSSIGKLNCTTKSYLLGTISIIWSRVIQIPFDDTGNILKNIQLSNIRVGKTDQWNMFWPDMQRLCGLKIVIGSIIS